MVLYWHWTALQWSCRREDDPLSSTHPSKSTKHNCSLQALNKGIKARPEHSCQAMQGMWGCPYPTLPTAALGDGASAPRESLAWPEGLSAYSVLLMGKNTEWYGEGLLHGLGILSFECGFEGAHNSTFNNIQLLFNYHSIAIKYTCSVSWSFILCLYCCRFGCAIFFYR